jgi:hypothetical protein
VLPFQLPRLTEHQILVSASVFNLLLTLAVVFCSKFRHVAAEGWRIVRATCFAPVDLYFDLKAHIRKRRREFETST